MSAFDVSKNTASIPTLFLSVRKMKSPLLILHAEDDHLVSFHMAEEVILIWQLELMHAITERTLFVIYTFYRFLPIYMDWFTS